MVLMIRMEVVVFFDRIDLKGKFSHEASVAQQALPHSRNERLLILFVGAAAAVGCNLQVAF